MSEPISTEEYHRMLGKKKRNKYNVAKTEARTFAGKVYASKAERDYAEALSIAIHAGDIAEVVEQPRLWLGVRENVYVPDFLIITKAGAHYVDVKGVETPAFRRVKKLWASYGRLPLRIVKKQGKKFIVSEIIPSAMGTP